SLFRESWTGLTDFLRARPGPHRRLQLGDPSFERGDGSLVPSLEPAARGVGELGEPFGEQAIGLLDEALDRAVELPREPARRLFDRTPDGRVELHRGLLGPPRRLPPDRPLDLLDQAPFDVGERLGELALRLGQLALDLVRQGPLAVAQSIGNLVERAP